MNRSFSIAALFAAALTVGCASHHHKGKMTKDGACCDDMSCCSDVEDKAHADMAKKDAASHNDGTHGTSEAGKPDKTALKAEKIELPAAVSAGFAKAYPGATITEVEKETYPSGEVHYEIKYKDATGEHEVELNDKGTLAHP